MPHAVRQVGWVLLVLIPLAGAVMTYTMSMVGCLMEKANAEADRIGIDVGNRDWSTVGMVTFGPAGKIAYGIVQMVQLFGTMVTFTMLGSTCLHDLFEWADKSWVISIFGLLMTLLMFVDVGRIGVLSKLGSLAVSLLVLSLFMTWMQILFDGGHPEHKNFDFKQGSSAIGVLLLLFGAHGEAPFLYQNMATPAEWPRAVYAGMGVAAVCYVLVGAIGYAAFGGAAQGSFSNNVGRDLDLQMLPGVFNVWLARMSLALMALKILTTQPLIGLPIVVSVREQAGLGDAGTRCLKCVVPLSATLLSLRLDRAMIASVGWFGSVVENSSALLLPVLAYWKCRRGLVSKARELVYLLFAAACAAYLVHASVAIM